MQIETDYVFKEEEVKEAIRQYLNNKTNVAFESMAGIFVDKHQNGEITARVRLRNQEIK
ncbi:hypothetical protein HYP99_gp026 [Sinorhizobium phage ort11]|uniref:Uncharacterized protein n=1 Tax=Sinorhizobium phage ort11 TaxID=2599764 RepID=A0A5C2H1C2_9CAUD|nr:hypothetical protein HYP99_gp026 [Sinorhizobium phage ort11]QEP29824.1 hypothetical protein Smphiort11_026 [Sinorhizobium phage ort11]